ncbi:hypothetical protein PGT21_018659 [Puccinia graminis f. sp. tritici]|uniref:Uncharacterized protein n=1 Tax=Puccinia graminis f. sp. tritici TaxID=56615 RepID=A0A5B0LM08_PUCGR|nr:hypothetical protein PGT21_018659 [Puccinia graminis f. sp. tritici]
MWTFNWIPMSQSPTRPGTPLGMARSSGFGLPLDLLSGRFKLAHSKQLFQLFSHFFKTSFHSFHFLSAHLASCTSCCVTETSRSTKKNGKEGSIEFQPIFLHTHARGTSI